MMQFFTRLQLCIEVKIDIVEIPQSENRRFVLASASPRHSDLAQVNSLASMRFLKLA